MPSDKMVAVIDVKDNEKLEGLMAEYQEASIQQKVFEKAKSYVKGFFAPAAIQKFYEMKAEKADRNSFVVHQDDSGVVVVKAPNPGFFKRGGGFDYKAAVQYIEENGLMDKAAELDAIYETKPVLRARFSKEVRDSIEQKWEAAKGQYDVMKDAPMKSLIAFYAGICKQEDFYSKKKEILGRTIAKEITTNEAYKPSPAGRFAYKDSMRCTLEPGEKKIGKNKFAEIVGAEKMKEFIKPGKEPETQPDLSKPVVMFYTPESYEKHLSVVKEIMDKKAAEQQKEPEPWDKPAEQQAPAQEAPVQEEPAQEEEFSGGFDEEFDSWGER